MLNWLGISAVNPALLWGGLLIAAPILIHLLNRRKFKVIDWAAMDFLLDADRRNRRRVRLEDWLLLALRCLAILLLAALVARPFLKPTGLAAQALHAVSLERIVLLDDSPSMQVRSGKATAFEDARQGLVDFIRELSAERSGDTFTLILTSQPERPIFNGQYLDVNRAEEMVRAVQSLKPSDLVARLDQALRAVEGHLGATSGNQNRVVYLIGDMRRRDWLPASAPAAAGRAASGVARSEGVPELLRRVARKAEGCFVIDVGNDEIDNVLITDIRPLDKTLVAGVDARFEVGLLNAGASDVDDLEVRLFPGEALDVTGKVPLLSRGERASLPFTVRFRDAGAVAVRAELTSADVLPVDNKRHFAARVRDGVSVLIVDGDPSSENERAESFLLSRALAPPGPAASGNKVEIITDSQFDGLALNKYQVIFLANVYRVSEEQVRALDAWVRAGGGLVVAAGDQVDDQSYNQHLYRGGAGLLPAKLESMQGDETERTWVNLSVERRNHPVLGIFEGAQNPFLKAVHVYRWWETTVAPADASAGRATVAATFTDADLSPAIVEKAVGNGRVMLLATALDADWNSWPGEWSYVITMLELARYMARGTAEEGNVIVGTRLHYDVDLAQYKLEARLTVPGQEPATVQAAAPGAAGSEARMAFDHDDTAQSGMYRLDLARRSGETETVLFAANLDPSEGELARVDAGELRTALGDARVQFERGRASLSLAASGSRAEMWPTVLFAVGAVLCSEQMLAWFLGRKRQ